MSWNCPVPLQCEPLSFHSSAAIGIGSTSLADGIWGSPCWPIQLPGRRRLSDSSIFPSASSRTGVTGGSLQHFARFYLRMIPGNGFSGWFLRIHRLSGFEWIWYLFIRRDPMQSFSNLQRMLPLDNTHSIHLVLVAYDSPPTFRTATAYDNGSRMLMFNTQAWSNQRQPRTAGGAELVPTCLDNRRVKTVTHIIQCISHKFKCLKWLTFTLW